MNVPDISLQIFFVEDDPHDLERIRNEMDELLGQWKVRADITTCDDFDEALKTVRDPSRHFDLIVSDTYRGPTGNGDAEVLSLVQEYKKGKFTPLVVISSGAKPADLDEGPFLKWAGKTPPNAIENAIKEMLDTGIPQLSRRLHSELNASAGGFLWHFLEKNWDSIKLGAENKRLILERLIRRRAATLIAEVVYKDGLPVPVEAVAGLEYYFYPPLRDKGYQLGSIVRKRDDHSDLRVILTPHCHLHIQDGQNKPRAESVLTVRAINAKALLGDKIANLRAEDQLPKRKKKLLYWATPPSPHDLGKPEGRFWFLPEFLQIPYSFCDFMDIHSVKYDELENSFETLATLSPPFAESLQSRFVGYYGSVGVSVLDVDSISSLLE